MSDWQNPRRASEQERAEAREIAQAVLDGKLGLLEGVNAILCLTSTDVVANLEDRMFIVATASEMDGLPIGEVRKYWLPASLKEKDIAIARFEANSKDDLIAIFRAVLNDNS